MDHLAILAQKLHVLEKLLSGEKRIETRWYQNKVAPWNRVNTGDTVYFKDSGAAVTAYALVKMVKQFKFSTPEEALPRILQYRNELGFSEDAFTNLSWLQKKHFGILVFLDTVHKIENPFYFNKKGFGSTAAWLCLSKPIEEYRVA